MKHNNLIIEVRGYINVSSNLINSPRACRLLAECITIIEGLAEQPATVVNNHYHVDSLVSAEEVKRLIGDGNNLLVEQLRRNGLV